LKIIPGNNNIPLDADGDEKFEDVNGNSRRDFNDIVLYFNQMAWISMNEPISMFDCNGNGRLDVADVVWLFNNL
jgi:PKD repeat protein